MGPQHPSTHGVLRLMLELEGETVLRCKPVIGYLHTGMEKTASSSPTSRAAPTSPAWTTPRRSSTSWCSPGAEKLLGIEVPERATWIRMLMCELNRLSSHLLFLATNGMDLGAVDDDLRLA
jgi:NADH-quinone oxidoreductase subunit D